MTACIRFLVVTHTFIFIQRLPVFEQLGASEHYRSQMLSIGCGVGIAASFGAPFGGTIHVPFLLPIFFVCFHDAEHPPVCSHPVDQEQLYLFFGPIPPRVACLVQQACYTLWK